MPKNLISLKNFTKHLTLANIVTGILIYIIFFIIRSYILSDIYYVIHLTFLDNMPLKFYIDKDLASGILAIICRFSLKGFVEAFLEVYGPPKLSIDNGTFAMNEDNIEGLNTTSGDNNTTTGVQSKSKNISGDNKEVNTGDSKTTLEDNNITSVDNKTKQKILNTLYTETIQGEFKQFELLMSKTAKSLEDRNTMYNRGNISLNEPEVPTLLVMMIQDQTRFLNTTVIMRMEWIQVILPGLPEHVKADIKVGLSEIAHTINKLQADNTSNIEKVRSIKDEKQQVKEFFDLTNAYRNKVRKEIIKYETLVHNGYKNNDPELYKTKEFKQLINKDVPQIIKKVVDQDSYLKSKISEIINAAKK